MDKYKKLKSLILSDDTLVVPDAYNGISARLIEYAGFSSVQCSGYCFSVSKKLDDESFVSLDENLKTTEEITNAVELPVFADGEDGYGCGELFKRNIKKFVKSGVAGINIEDQNIWTPYLDDKVVPTSVMLQKIDTILELKKELNVPDFILNARTDILGCYDNRNLGLSKAIERANLYLEAGADLAFVTNVKTKDEIKILKKEIAGPISIAAGLAYNIDNYDINDCREIGIARVSLPSTLLLSSIKAQLETLNILNLSGSFKDVKKHLVDIDILKNLR